MTSDSVDITAYARLHFGFFDLNGNLGRNYAGMGVSLQSPQMKLSFSYADEWRVEGDGFNDVAWQLIDAFIQETLIKEKACIQIQEIIPQHIGLGSGTQFSLSIISGLSQLFNIVLPFEQIVRLAKRGKRSGIGCATFQQGGFILDFGRKENDPSFIFPTFLRLPFPEEWVILLIYDIHVRGLHGYEEISAFQRLSQFSVEESQHLCRSVLIEGLPALLEGDILGFGKVIRTLQDANGNYFSTMQGGKYSSPYVSEVMQELRKMNAPCFGQSSWGPTGFAIFKNNETGISFVNRLDHYSSKGIRFFLTKARN